MKSLAILATAASFATAGTAAALPAGAAVPAGQYEGTVVSVDRAARTFDLRDSRRGTARIRVTFATRFERVGGFAGLRAGLTGIQATVRRVGGAGVATKVERSGGGSSDGGRRGGGADDHGRHGGNHG
jgi:hypothetical protein